MNKKIYYYLTLIVTLIFFYSLFQTRVGIIIKGSNEVALLRSTIQAINSGQWIMIKIGVYLGIVLVIWSHALFTNNKK